MTYITPSEKLQIGRYTIEVLQFPNNHKEVWIQKESGEAGEFDYAKFEDAVDVFFQENF